MSGILDQVAATQHSHIRPETPAAFLTLQLVRKLKLDADSAEQYLNLGEKYSPSQLLTAYRRIGHAIRLVWIPRAAFTWS